MVSFKLEEKQAAIISEFLAEQNNFDTQHIIEKYNLELDVKIVEFALQNLYNVLTDGLKSKECKTPVKVIEDKNLHPRATDICNICKGDAVINTYVFENRKIFVEYICKCGNSQLKQITECCCESTSKYIDIMRKFEFSDEGDFISSTLTSKEIKMIRRALLTMDAIEDVVDDELGLK